MIEYMKLSGSPVRVSSIQQRAIGKPDGAVAREWKIVIVVRGIAAHRQVADLLKQQPLTIAFPNDEGWEEEILVEIASASHTEAGAKGAESFRHLLTLREIDRTTADRLTREAEASEPANLAIRLEALIDALVAANLLDRAAVETAEQRIRERQAR